MTEQDRQYDVVIVGGGAAGLSAGLMLGRARRSVLVVDGGQPRNAPAAHVHGFLTRDGMPPGELLAAGRKEVAGYGGEFADGEAISASRVGDGFAVELDGGRRVRARRLLVASGITDELPDIPGLAQRWGRDVLHCPYCHGWEFRDQPIGVIATGPMSVHQALLFRQWTEDVTLLLHSGQAPVGEEAEQLAARGVNVVHGEVAAVEAEDEELTGARLTSGELVPLRALAVAPRSRPRAQVLDALGLRPQPHASGIGDYIAADAGGATEVPGVWVAGNIANPGATVLIAAASGSTAAGMINADLIGEEARNAVARRKAEPFSHEAEARNCTQVMGERRHGITARSGGA